MLQNYLKAALRNYRNNKLYATLNLIGLVIGYAACILIGLYLHYEISFENFHHKSDRIYRATHHTISPNFEVHWARTHFDQINELPNEIPEIEHLIRFQNHGRRYVRQKDQKFSPKHVYVTDAEVFDVFDFKLIMGDPKTALKEPLSIVLTESIAEKYFGHTDVLGKQLLIIREYSDEEVAHTITGIMADLPSNTHLPVELLISFQNEEERSWWAYVYVLLKEGVDIETVEAKMPDFLQKFTEEGQEPNFSYEFQPLANIHLGSHLAREIVPNGNMIYIKVFGFTGLFILLIAMINYLNLSSAMAMGRSKEIGMRLVLGAEKNQLKRLALFESILYHIVAIGFGLVIAFFVLLDFQGLMEVEMILQPIELISIAIGIGVLSGIVSGVYPAFILTASSSLQMLRHNKSFNLTQSSSSFHVKRILVGLQFCTSILLISSAWIARDQVTYLKNKNLGMNSEQVLAIPAVPNPVTDEFPAFRDRMKTIPGVMRVAACMEVPSREIRDAGPTFIEGENHDAQQAPMLDMQVISPGFLEIMEIELLAGEDRSDRYIFKPNPQFTSEYTPKDYLDGESRTYLINETAMRKLGWQSPEEAIGKRISWSIGGFELAAGPVTGVVKDFYQETLKNKVDPTIMITEQIWLRTFLLKVETKNIKQTIEKIQAEWNYLYPAYPLDYYFVDELYDQLYKNERKQLALLVIFSGLAIFIAFLGLFSLVAFTLQTRVKENAIRRILGAQLADLVKLISKEYALVLFIGGLIAIPLSYIGVRDWLDNFAYRVEVSPWPYLLSMVIIAILLLGTVSLQTFRSTLKNPSETLREK